MATSKYYKRFTVALNDKLVNESDRMRFTDPSPSKPVTGESKRSVAEGASAGSEIPDPPNITDDLRKFLMDNKHLKASAQEKTARGASTAEATTTKEEPFDAMKRERMRSPAYQAFMKLDRPYLTMEMEASTSDKLLLKWDGTSASSGGESVMSLLRSRKLNLPVYPAVFDSLLLMEAGTFYYDGRPFTFPACKAADECVGKRMLSMEGMPSGGIVFMICMNMEELDSFMLDGRAPMGARSCLACTRVNVIRTSTSLFGDSRFTVEEVIQTHRNETERIGGYHKTCVHAPREGVWTGMTDPISTFRETDIVIRKCPINGRHYADQSRMICQPAIQSNPQLGESMQGF